MLGMLGNVLPRSYFPVPGLFSVLVFWDRVSCILDKLWSPILSPGWLSKSIKCPHLSGAKLTGVCHHTWLPVLFLITHTQTHTQHTSFPRPITSSTEEKLVPFECLQSEKSRMKTFRGVFRLGEFQAQWMHKQPNKRARSQFERLLVASIWEQLFVACFP